MRSVWTRLLAATVVGLFLPFPGPHIDRYIPLVQVATHVGSDADAAFYVLFMILLSVYTAVAFGILSLIARRRAPRA